MERADLLVAERRCQGDHRHPLERQTLLRPNTAESGFEVSRPARRANGHAQPAPRTVRRAGIYVRVSTDEQAVLEFNSLQAQEQICKTYISMRNGDPAAAERWEQADTYSDSGFSGGTLERPALRRLLTDVEAGRVDTILIYKIDRLSRSIHQFYRIWELMEHYRVDLVSATQDLNTSTSQGKLMLNMLLSFGQFEREQISERTRDKVAAARKNGRWTGGHPILGYDVDPRGGRLVVNEAEASMVQEIFRLYLTTPSLTKVVEELGRRGWRRKTWTLRSGALRSGAAFDKLGLMHLLRNPLYLGKVPHRGTLHPGQHDAIVPNETWQRAQECLTRNGSAGYQGERENHDALLKGLLHCAQCGCRMSPTYTSKGGRRYRYYTCQSRIRQAHTRASMARWRRTRLSRESSSRSGRSGEIRSSLLRRHGRPGRSKASVWPGMRQRRRRYAVNSGSSARA